MDSPSEHSQHNTFIPEGNKAWEALRVVCESDQAPLIVYNMKQQQVFYANLKFQNLVDNHLFSHNAVELDDLFETLYVGFLEDELLNSSSSRVRIKDTDKSCLLNVSKDFSGRTELVVLRFTAFLQDAGAKVKISASTDWDLTLREQELISCLPRGLSNKKMAYELNLTPSYLNNALAKIYKKMGVRNRTQALLKLLDKAK